MYKAFWGMKFNPFTKELETKNAYNGADHQDALKRGEYLKNVRGIGLFTGAPGVGKTFFLRTFTEDLNPALFRAVYLPLTTIPSTDFYRALARGLNLEPAYKKVDNFRRIQERIREMRKDQKVTPVIIIDEAQYLNNSALTDLKLLMNFDMDSRNHAIMMLAGHPELNETLAHSIHESLAQRIVVNFNFQGLSHDEVSEYVTSRLELCGVNNSIFDAGALEAASGGCKGSIRRLNDIIHSALMIGCDEKAKLINRKIIEKAIDENELV